VPCGGGRRHPSLRCAGVGRDRGGVRRGGASTSLRPERASPPSLISTTSALEGDGLSPLLQPDARPERALQGGGSQRRAASPPEWSRTGMAAVVAEGAAAGVCTSQDGPGLGRSGAAVSFCSWWLTLAVVLAKLGGTTGHCRQSYWHRIWKICGSPAAAAAVGMGHLQLLPPYSP
jgi:hypothetical protein